MVVISEEAKGIHWVRFGIDYRLCRDMLSKRSNLKELKPKFIAIYEAFFKVRILFHQIRVRSEKVQCCSAEIICDDAAPFFF